MSAALPPAAAIGVLVATRADRGVLASFLAELGHEVIVLEPCGERVPDLERASLIIVDEPSARKHGHLLLAAKERLKPVIVPVLVALSGGADGAAWLRRGYDELLRLPAQKSDLLARIETFLRLHRQSEQALRNSEAFSRSTLDAIPANICVVDARGQITLSNCGWRRFSEENEGQATATCEGANYLDVCRRALDNPDPEVRAATAAILHVLEGKQASAAIEYPCHSPTERRWFSVNAVRYAVAGAEFCVVSHYSITARRKSELSARTAETKFRSLVELSSDFYWETDAEHRLAVRSPGGAADALAALGGAALLGRRRWDLPFLTPDADGWKAHQADLDARRAFRDFEYSRQADDGRVFHFSISGEPVFDEQGAFAGFRGVGSDVTKRKREERLIAMEHAVTRCLSEAENAGSGLRAMIRVVCETKGWDLGRYWRHDPSTGQMRPGESWSAPDTTVEAYLERTHATQIAPGEGTIGRVLQSGKPLWVSDAEFDVRILPHVRKSGLRGACHVPVIADGATIGVLSFAGRAVREPDERLLAALCAIGGQVGQFLRRREAEAVLRASEGRYRALAGLAADWYWELDEELCFSRLGSESGVSASPLAEGLIGKRAWETEYMSTGTVTWGAHKAALEAHKPFRDFEIAWRREDGTHRHFLASGHPVFDGLGRFSGYRGFSRDITERRRAEQLRDLEHAVARCLAEASDARAAMREILRVVCEARGLACAHYFELDEGAGLMRFAAGWSDNHEATRHLLESASRLTFRPGEGSVGNAWQAGTPLRINDLAGDPRFRDPAPAIAAGMRGVLIVPIRFEGRAEGVVSLFGRHTRKVDPQVENTTRAIAGQIGQFLARARMQERQRESEARFRDLTLLSSDWYWEQDADLRISYLSDSFELHAGFDRSRMIGRAPWESPLQPVGPDWKERRRSLESREPFHALEYTWLGDDGERRHFLISGTPVFGKAGEFLGYRGVGSNVTQRRRDEASLHRFRTALNASEDAFYLVNVESLRLVDVNDAACRATGYAREELLGRSPAMLFQDVDDARLRADYDLLMQHEGEAEVVRGIHVRKDGTCFPVEVVRQMFRNHDGIYVVGLARDISHRIAQEQALQESNERLEVQAARQSRIARFGEFALRRRSADQLVTEAVAELADQGDVVAMFEIAPEDRIMLRLAHGSAVEESIGHSAPLLPESAVSRVLDSGAAMALSPEYLAAAPDAWPWSGWMRQMRAGAFVAVTHNGHAHGVLGVFSRKEGAIGDEVRSFAASIGNLLSTALQREHAEQRLATLAQFDALTGLPNRSLLEDRLGQTIAQAKRKQRQAGFLYIDLDRFKLVNDTYGHLHGDDLLRQVASRLKGCVREDDTVARIAGDEFSVVLADLARGEDAAPVTQKILDELARPFVLEGSEAFVGASIGVSLFPTDGEDAGTLMRNADMAMYRAKKASRNTYRFFTAKMNQRTVTRLQLHTDLRQAIERQEFVLHYQPKVDLKTGALAGAEALLRWNHPRRGLVPPVEFIPVLEESGLILPAGEWVLEEACAQLQRWRQAGLCPVPVAVNISAKQFRPDYLDHLIERVLAAKDLPSQLLELEITESGLAEDPADAARVLGKLRDAGLTIALDDFGTGYSSLAYLSNLPLSSLKIDRSFVSKMLDEPNALTLVETIVTLSHSLRLKVIAEGVETEEQARMLRLLRCDEMQGYLFSKPLPFDQMTAMLQLEQTRGSRQE